VAAVPSKRATSISGLEPRLGELSMPSSTSKPQIGSHGLRVLLVHGTWARGFIRKTPVARWCRPDSMFVDRLLGELEERMPTVATSIIPVAWCGSNSILRRAKAANDLRNQLEALAKEGPILIIGHSHGGNVVMQAASKLRDLSNVYVCTLATPFFRLFESDRTFVGAKPLLRTFSIGVCTLAAMLLAGSEVLEEMMVIPVVLVGVVGGWIGGGLLFRLLINPIPKARMPSRWQLRSRLLCDATTADARLLMNHLLVLRGIDDEAALSLAAGAVANRLFRVAYKFSLNVMLGPFSTIRGAKWWALFLPGIYFAPLLLALVLCAVFFGPHVALIGIVLVLVTAVSSLFLAPLTRTVFGRELALGSMGCDAFFESAPDSELIVTLPLSKNEALYHALYENPLAPPTIASWIAAHLQH
jgi:hypothetical protein